MSGLGSFLTGVVKGAETRRQWKRQDRQDEIAEEDRKQRKEHYDYTRERTDRLDAQNAEDRARNNEWQDYQRDITREEQDRADAARAAARDAYAATVAAGEEDPAPATNRGPTMSTSGGQRPRRLTLPGVPSMTGNGAAPQDAGFTPRRLQLPGVQSMDPYGTGGTPPFMPADQAAAPAPRQPAPQVQAPEMPAPAPMPMPTSSPVAPAAPGGAPVRPNAAPNAPAPAPAPDGLPQIEARPSKRFQRAMAELQGDALSPRLAEEADMAEAALNSGVNPANQQPLNAYEIEELQQVVAAAEQRMQMDAANKRPPAPTAPEGPYPAVRNRDGIPMSDAALSRSAERRAMIDASRIPNPRGVPVPTEAGPEISGGSIAAAQAAEMAGAQGRDAARMDAPQPPAPGAPAPRQMQRPGNLGPAPQPGAAPTPDMAPGVAPGPTPAQAATAGDGALDAAVDASKTSQQPPSVDAAAAVVNAPGKTLPPSSAPKEVVAKRRKTFQTDFMTRYAKVGAPRMVEHYLAAGEVEKAAAYQGFIETTQAKNAMKHWSDAVFAASMGDDDAFLDGMTRAYNAKGYFDDGYEAVPGKSGIIRDGAGNVMGAEITFRDTQSGKVFTQRLDTKEDLYQLGVHMLSPEQVFEHGYAQIEKTKARRAAIHDEARKQRQKLTQSDEKRINDAVEMLGKSDLQFANLPMEEQVARAWAYVQRFTPDGQLRTPVPGNSNAAPAEGQRVVPRY